jgi:hypothetical protein
MYTNTHANENRAIMRVWEYLWRTYYDNGSVPRDISDAISLIQSRIVGAK